jgi:hypothetical protein
MRVKSPKVPRLPSLARIGFALLLFLGVVAAGGWTIIEFLRPPVTSNWTPIFQGVDYLCEEMSLQPDSGRALAIRVDLQAPGVEFVMRPLDQSAVDKGAHFRLALADFEMSRLNLSVLINTDLYTPGRRWESYPGQAVRAVDTLIIDSKPTHFYEHSYMFWVDQSKVPHLELRKPPKLAELGTASWGIGLQGVQVANGIAGRQATDSAQMPDARAFIGFDLSRRYIYLIALEHATTYTAMDFAIKVGVGFGGALDSGSATHLIFSSEAKGLRPRTGIRGSRPLGPYLGVRARPLNQ